MWRKTRFFFRLGSAFLTRHLRLLLIGLILGIIGFWLIPRVTSLMPKIRSTHRIGIIGRFEQSNLPSQIMKDVSFGLTQIDEQGLPYPGIAKEWSANEQGKNWTFTVDPNLTWSDGQPIKSTDIQFNFKDVNITYPNAQKINFQLPDIFSPFPTVLSDPLTRTDRVGIGPYKITKLKMVGQYIQSLTLNPANETSTLNIKKYHFYGTENAAITAFKLGEIDTILDLTDVKEFTNWPNVEITQKPQEYHYVGLFFNLNEDTGNPNLQDKSTRQALAYALPDQSFGFQPVLSPIMSYSWAHNPHVKPYEHDLERAKTLWGEFEMPEGEYIQLSTAPSLLSTAEEVAKQWTEFGLPTQVRVINTIPNDFDVLLVTQEVPRDPDQYVLWHSTQPTNLTRYQNPKIDKLLEDGRKELDLDTRQEIYLEFQRTLLEDLPVIFLYQPVTYTITRK